MSSNSTLVPPPKDFGTWASPVAIATMLVTLPLMLLFIGNWHLYPLKQREPKWALIACFSYNLVIWMYMFEKVYPEMPIWWTKIHSQLGEGIMMCLFLVRTWKLYIDAGLTTERVRNQFGWFVAHRHYRSKQFLLKMVLVLVTFHLCIVPIEFVLVKPNNIPARQSDNSLAGPLLFAAIVLSYFIVFSIFGCKIRKLRDGFFIKTELVMVGLVGMIGTLLWLGLEAARVPCLFPSCSVFILWVTSTWMVGWSIVMPLAVAARDPRFSFTRCFSLRRYETEESELSTRVSSAVSTEVSLGEPHALTEEKLARLLHIPLKKFLAYAPGKEAFRAFTVLEFSVENLLFVEAVQELAATPHTSAEVRAVFARFVADSAPNQVNLPHIIVQRVKARVEDECDAKALEEAIEHVYKMMQRDTFKRFQKTPEWAMHIAVFDVEKHLKDKHGNSNNVEMADAPPDSPNASSADTESSTRQSEDTVSTRVSSLDHVALIVDKTSHGEDDHPN